MFRIYCLGESRVQANKLCVGTVAWPTSDTISQWGHLAYVFKRNLSIVRKKKICNDLQGMGWQTLKTIEHFHVLFHWNPGKRVLFPPFLEDGFLFILKKWRFNIALGLINIYMYDRILCFRYKVTFLFFSPTIFLTFLFYPFLSSGKV